MVNMTPSTGISGFTSYRWNSTWQTSQLFKYNRSVSFGANAAFRMLGLSILQYMNITYGLIFCTGHSDGLHIIGEHRESNQRPAQFHPLQRDPGTEGRRDLPQRRSSINFLTDQHRQRGGGLHAVRYVTLKRHFPRYHHQSSEFKTQNNFTMHK